MSLTTPPETPIADYHPRLDTFRDDFVAGLRARPRELSPKYFYDAEGSRLFDDICELEEYFPTRTELRIMRRFAEQIRAAVGPRRRIVEFGSGSSLKTRLLLDMLDRPAVYVPIEISKSCLREAARQLALEYPDVETLPVCADYTDRFGLPSSSADFDGTTIFFPGSTIGNFRPDEAVGFLDQARRSCGKGCSLLLGAGLQTDQRVLERAYDDTKGVTAAFNRNVLWRAKRELGARVDPQAFEHEARYNALEGRIEMRLVSKVQQTIEVDGERFDFAPGEAILTEISQKFTIEGLRRLAGKAGFQSCHVWTDERQRFSVHYFESR